MKICLDARFRTLSGSGLAGLNLIPELIKGNRGHEFVLLLCKDQRAPPLLGVKKLRVPFRNPILEILWTNIWLPILLRKLKCNLYVSFKQPVGPYLSNLPKIFYRQHVLGKYKGISWGLPWKRHLYWFVFGKMNIVKSNRLIAASHFIKESLTEGLNYPEDRIDVIHNGVAENFKKLDISEIVEERKRQSLPELFLFCCGNVIPRKNHETAIFALKYVKKKHPNMKLVISGATDDSHYRHLKSLISKLELENDTIFTGLVDKEELIGLYNCASVFVFPSLAEAFPLVLLEALKCGVPIVASKVGGNAEAIGSAGILIEDPKDHKAFAEGICKLMNNHTRADYQRRSLKQARKFSWENAALLALQSFEKAAL